VIKFAVVGLGVQGNKRIKYLNKRKYITIDPYKKSDYKSISQAPLSAYDAVIICVPDEQKLKIIEYCLSNGKHFLVEKPFPIVSNRKLKQLEKLSIEKKLVSYVAYNHRFEPNIQKVKKIINKKKIGKLYFCKIFYGNGTAKLVKDSSWRDKRSGVIEDIGSHLIDMIIYLFNFKEIKNYSLFFNKFENKSPDHAQLIFKQKNMNFLLEMSLCMWRNTFNFDLVGSKGSVHISSLCKWDKTVLTLRKRKYPSGKPSEKTFYLKMPDPTWKKELDYFLLLVKKNKKSSLKKELIINNIFNQIRNMK
jgi:scyllo-inositol 2-dehydrogenase (NADP+)